VKIVRLTILLVMNITRTDIGVGLGAGMFRVLILFENREVLGKFRGGIRKFGVAAESAAGTSSAGLRGIKGAKRSKRNVVHRW
jgi:hypothetical protein